MRIIYRKRATLCSYSHTFMIAVAQNNNSDQGHILYLTYHNISKTALFLDILMHCTNIFRYVLCVYSVAVAAVWDINHTELRLPPILLQHKYLMFATGIRIYYLKKDSPAVYVWYISDAYNLARNDCVWCVNLCDELALFRPNFVNATISVCRAGLS